MSEYVRRDAAEACVKALDLEKSLVCVRHGRVGVSLWMTTKQCGACLNEGNPNPPSMVRDIQDPESMVIDALRSLPAAPVDALVKAATVMKTALYQLDHLAKCLAGGYGPKHPPSGVCSDDLFEALKPAMKAIKAYNAALAALDGGGR